jgi:hypothetical protein
MSEFSELSHMICFAKSLHFASRSALSMCISPSMRSLFARNSFLAARVLIFSSARASAFAASEKLGRGEQIKGGEKKNVLMRKQALREKG